MPVRCRRLTWLAVAGLALLEMFHWTMYVFGVFLLGTGVWMVVKKVMRHLS